MKRKRITDTQRKGKPFFVHISPDHCRCHWSATSGPAEMGAAGWWLVDTCKIQHIGANSSRVKFHDWFNKYGILPRPGKQICLQVVEVPMKVTIRAKEAK